MKLEAKLGAALLAGAIALLAGPQLASAQITLPFTEDWEGTSGETYQDYAAALTGAPEWQFRTGREFTAGALNTSIGTGAFIAVPQYLIFDTASTVILEAVDVRVQAAGNVTITLYDSNLNPLQARTVNVATANTMVTIPVEFVIPAGTGYRISNQGSAALMYRNTSGASYPYVSGGGQLSITGNTFDPTYYYFFYDWLVRELDDGLLDTDVGSGFAQSGTGAATLSRATVCEVNVGPINDLIATLNMTNYNVNNDQVVLDFGLMSTNDEVDAADAVSVRGSDSDPWVQLADLHALKGADGVYASATNLDVSAALANASQNFSATFQLRFSQFDDCYVQNTIEFDGFTFDDISLHLASVCGDMVIEGSEGCDDGNTADNDGCSSTCAVESGWMCAGQPSVCSETCGDSIIVGSETCDDGNTTDLDGCDSMCATESGWNCTGQPSVCTEDCGDGLVVGAEACDDGNTTAGDGCDAACAVESGYDCTGEPSVCDGICGDSQILGNETCDDGNTASGDGCDGNCATERGWTCNGEPSTCNTTCGDGLIAGTETCDDGNAMGGDGCDGMCMTENGFTCTGEPSVCTPDGGTGGAGGSGVGGGSSSSGAGGGGTGAGTGTGSSSSGGSNDNDGGDDGGCGCVVPGNSNNGGHGNVAWLALLGLALLRRRRR